jgi:hypothetical protein
MNYLRYLLIAGLAFAASMAAPAQSRADWELLGEKDVGLHTDHDVVRVGRAEGRFDRIRLRVRGNDIEMLDLKVVYANGAVDDIRVRHFIRAGDETRPLDLRGDRGQRIERIEMVYRSRRNFRGQAHVQVWGDSVRRGDHGRDEGRRGDHGRDDDRRGEHGGRRHYDWELLGRRKVGLFADRDVIDVGGHEGKFRRIKLRVRGNDIHIFDLKVVYGNGTVDDIPVRQKLREGSETPPLDLRGRDRIIRRVEMTYGRVPNLRGHATVEVWGLQVDD